MEATIVAEYEALDHYAGEDIRDTLNALKPYLLYRQAIARKIYNADYTIIALKECNEKIIKILSIPQK